MPFDHTFELHEVVEVVARHLHIDHVLSWQRGFVENFDASTMMYEVRVGSETIRHVHGGRMRHSFMVGDHVSVLHHSITDPDIRGEPRCEK